jgi:hypothetical protein
MSNLLIAIVGDATPGRYFDPPMRDAAEAKRAAYELGGELALRGARLLVYGGPFIEADVVAGFVAAKPARDRSILMAYTKGQEPPPFPEEATHPQLFDRRSEQGADWEIAFYRSIARADGIILIGGANSTAICGHVAIGTRMPILTLADFGGAAARVWETLSAGEDLPIRDEISLMARPWRAGSASACIDALFAQHRRRVSLATAPKPVLSILAALLFLPALSIVPFVWGSNLFSVWMLFIAPLLAGGAGAAIRPVVDRLRAPQQQPSAPAVLATIILGLIAGGVAGVLFVTAQLTANPSLLDAAPLDLYARRSIPYALGVGFIAGLTSDAVFGKLLGLDVIRTPGVELAPQRAATRQS